MKAYTDLVFEYAKQTVKLYGQEKVHEVQNWGHSPAPWKRASADLVDSDHKKFVTRERTMKWIKCLLEHLYVKVETKYTDRRLECRWEQAAHHFWQT